MPSFVQTIDVNSPLVEYLGPWQLGGADGDPEVVKYNQDTFVYCANTGCFATISFNGTEVHVVGAYRLNSGPFQVELDGETFGPFGTTPTVVEQFQIDLFNQTDLTAGPHSLTISNLPPIESNKPNLNLDYFSWTNEINSLDDVRLQDDTPAFSYEPSTAWSSFTDGSSSFPDFDGGTGHSTVQGGATVAFSFKGDRVALYGAIGSLGGPYTVQIDNGSVSHYTAQSLVSDATTPLPNYLAGQLLFYADSLSSGNHMVTITANPGSPTQDLTMDYAIVDGTLNSNSTVIAQSSRPGARPLSSADIGGIATGAIVFIIFFLLGLWYTLYLRRRRKNLSVESTGASAQAEGTPYPPLRVALPRPRREKGYPSPFVNQRIEPAPPSYDAIGLVFPQ